MRTEGRVVTTLVADALFKQGVLKLFTDWA